MVYVREYNLELGAFDTLIVLFVEHIHSGAGGMMRRERDIGKTFTGLKRVAKQLKLNSRRFKSHYKTVITKNSS